jgi:hypothetical protein
MFVICFESVVITARRHALERLNRQPAPLPRIATARWLLAPLPTWHTWRRAVLSEVDVEPVAVEITARSTRAASRRSSSPSGKTQRLEAVHRVLHDRPELTAVQLAEILGVNGHKVSVRTAQRLRSKALGQGIP